MGSWIQVTKTYEDGHRAPDDYARQFGWSCVVWKLPRPSSKLRVPPRATLPMVLDGRGLRSRHNTLSQGWARVEGYARQLGVRAVLIDATPPERLWKRFTPSWTWGWVREIAPLHPTPFGFWLTSPTDERVPGQQGWIIEDWPSLVQRETAWRRCLTETDLPILYGRDPRLVMDRQVGLALIKKWLDLTYTP